MQFWVDKVMPLTLHLASIGYARGAAMDTGLPLREGYGLLLREGYGLEALHVYISAPDLRPGRASSSSSLGSSLFTSLAMYKPSSSSSSSSSKESALARQQLAHVGERPKERHAPTDRPPTLGALLH